MEQSEEARFAAHAKELTGKMTLEEKTAMLHGVGLFRTAGVERLGIPPLKMSDGPMGVRQEFPDNSWEPVGLPDDYVTYLPCNSAVAATWNRELAYRTGKVLGEEARGRGKDVILAPGVNLKRSPLCGRNFEYMSEDPCLTKELAVPLIRGIQESDAAACVKHFAVNNQETERLQVDVQVGERALHELYLPAFRACARVSLCLMSAYEQLRGEFCSQSKYLLNQLLRREWGYRGVVISDWGAVHDTRLAAESGLDVEMSVETDFDHYHFAQPLIDAVKADRVPEYLLNQKVEHILVLMQKLHMLDGAQRKPGTYDTAAHRQAALETAQESVVLLKNEDNLLPLPKKGLKKLLVIGANAVRTHAPGGGSAEIKALYEITPLLGIRTVLGGNTDIRWVKGYCADTQPEQSGKNWQAESLKNTAQNVLKNVTDALRSKRETLREEAVKLAGEYEHVVVIGGLNHRQDTEGKDRTSMKLPYEQDELIAEVLKANPNAVIVLTGGSPVEMGRWAAQAKAVVWGWYAGLEGGRALAEVLFGDVNPSGKLPETFAKRLEDCPAHSIGEFPGGRTVSYKENIFVGYRHFDTASIEPQFCFGHGLSYTQFAYSEPKFQLTETERELTVNIRCMVTNTGDRAGKETVQLYVRDPECSVARSYKELRSFCKLALAPGESRTAEMSLSAADFSFYDTENHVFKAEPGEYQILIGSSSRDIRLKTSIDTEFTHCTAE
ncbi:MAG: glycoside hydrolase family 3 C-terminal domain-containing protein [Oscillospiraceae bacterium]|jgi:beta-glucosidase|nr:glycoside hydrolase family 3 C-terminal domain-containing protein [Oscillospiraceae bacterium]